MRYIVIFLFLFSTVNLFGEIYGGNAQELDKLIKKYREADDDSLKMERLLEVISMKLDHLDKDNIDYIKEAEELAAEIGNEQLNAIVTQLHGIYLKDFQAHEEAIKYLYKALKYYDRTGELRKQGVILKDIGEAYRASSNLDQGIASLKKAVEIFEKLDDRKNLAHAYNRISAIYYEKIDDEKKTGALKYGEMSLKYMQGFDDPPLKISNLMILGATYAYLHKFKMAEDYLLKADSLCDYHSIVYHKPSITNNLIFLYTEWNRLDKAEHYVDVLFSIPLVKEQPRFYYYIYDRLSEVYRNKGNFRKAYTFVVKSANLRNEIFFKQKESALLELSKKYESDKQAEEIIYQQKINQYQLIIFAIVILCAIGAVWLFYSRHKVMQVQHELMIEKNDKLHELNATKDKFFSIIAHDIKNPVSSFDSALKLMVADYDRMDDDERKEYLELLNESATGLYTLLENLLTWSRSQRGKISFNTTAIIPEFIIDQVMSVQAFQASNKKVKLTKQIESSNPIDADPDMMNTVIRNLVSNAIKFTPEGGQITVGFEWMDGSPTFWVKDTGIGMEPKVADHIFDLDCTHTTPGTNNEKGTGLGLIICKEFVERHNGRIWTESKPGQGTSIYFTVGKVETME